MPTVSKRALFLAAAALLLVALPAAAQQILPASFSGWTATSSESVAPGGLTRFAGENAPALREYGATGAERRTYTKSAAQLTATVFRLHDASGAYGVFTFLRSDEMRDADLGRFSAISPERAVALVGNLVLLVEQPGGKLSAIAPELKGLVSAVYPRAQQGLLPVIGEYLPAKGQVPGSRRYTLGSIALNALLPVTEGDWIGFSDGAEVEFAKYRLGDAEVTLLVASYPTPQVAARRMNDLNRSLSAARSGTSGEPAFHLKRSASLLAVSLGAPSKSSADALLDPIRYDAELTWNEPGFSASDPSVAEMVLGAIYGTGALLALAIATGLGFGGLRVVLKYLLPGKLFDRTGSIEILQLGINSKPIEAKDFYTWTR